MLLLLMGIWVVAAQIFFMFIPKLGEDETILTHMFQRGWFNHQLGMDLESGCSFHVVDRKRLPGSDKSPGSTQIFKAFVSKEIAFEFLVHSLQLRMVWKYNIQHKSLCFFKVSE